MLSRPRLVHMLAMISLSTPGMVLLAGAVKAYTFCMVTAARPGGVSYLERVVQGYQEQQVFHMDDVSLAVIDVDGWTANRGETGVVHGYRLPARVMATCDTTDVEGRPSCKVRQRTFDVVGALAVCAMDTSGWVILVEDDCELCAGALSESLDVLAGLDPARVAMVKLSRNMCATAFSIHRVGDYSKACIERLYYHPHDIINVEAWSGPRDGSHAYTHLRNLWHHIGNVSTETHKNNPEWQAQYRDMREDTCLATMR
jgi:hypothetical protein